MKITRCAALVAVLFVAFTVAAPAGLLTNPDGSRSITIKLGSSAAQSAAALDHLAYYFGWSAAMGEAKAAYVERMVRETIRAWDRDGQLSEAAKIARDAEAAKTPVDMQ